MILLCSDGLSSPILVEKLKQSIHNCKYAALVVTADPVYKENNYHVPRCSAELQSMGLSVTNFDLDTDRIEDLKKFDVVEFIGGNPFYLLESIRQHNAIEVLKEIAENKILIGWSAAAFVFGPTLNLVNQYSPEMNIHQLADLTGLSLTHIEVLPHYSKFLKKFMHFEEICQAYESRYKITVIRLNDGDGVFIEGANTTVLRTDR